MGTRDHYDIVLNIANRLPSLIDKNYKDCYIKAEHMYIVAAVDRVLKTSLLTIISLNAFYVSYFTNFPVSLKLKRDRILKNTCVKGIHIKTSRAFLLFDITSDMCHIRHFLLYSFSSIFNRGIESKHYRHGVCV